MLFLLVKSIFPGATEETRTPDLLITNQLLYRLSYSSELGYFNTEHLKCQAKRILLNDRNIVVQKAEKLISGNDDMVENSDPERH